MNPAPLHPQHAAASAPPPPLPEPEISSSRSRHLITLLWLVINVLLVGLIFSSFFAAVETGGALSSTSCYVLTPSPAPTASPTLSRSATASPTPPTTDAPTASNSSYDYYVYDDANAGLVMIWTTLMMVALSCGGTTVLKSYRTPFVLGGFIGVIVVMANLMLILAIQAEGEVRRKSQTAVPASADKAVLVFSGLEFLFLSWFGYVLAKSSQFIIDPLAQPTRFEPALQANTMTTI